MILSRRRRTGRPLALVVLVALLASSTGCAYYNTFYLARKYYRLALIEEKKNTTGKVSPTASQNYDKVIKQCSKVLQRYGQSKWADDAMFLMGQAYYGQGQYSSSRRWYSEMMERYPASELVADARLGIAQSWLAEDNFDKATAGLAEVIEKHPDFRGMDRVLFFQAEVARRQERYADAIPLYRVLTERFPKSQQLAEALTRLGESYMGVKEYEEARRTFELSATRTIEPRQRFQSLLKAGQAMEKLDRYDDALKLYHDLSLELVSRDRLGVILAGFDNIVVTTTTINTTPGRTSEEEERQALTFTDAQGNVVLRNPAFKDQFPPGAGSTGDPDLQNPLVGDQARPPAVPPGGILPEGNMTARNTASQALAANSLASELPRVLLSQATALMEVARYDESISTFKAVLAAWPRTSESAEALYRIGYIQEVYLEDFGSARTSYDGVKQQAPGLFADQAGRRASGLARLVALAQADTTKGGGGLEAEKLAEKDFLAAELAYFQQEKADRAIEQYTSVELNYPQTSFAAKSAMARAWMLYYVRDDTAGGRQAYEEVVTKYPKTEQARMARQMLTGEVPPEELPTGAALDSLRAAAIRADSLAAANARAPGESGDPEGAVDDSALPGGKVGMGIESEMKDTPASGPPKPVVEPPASAPPAVADAVVTPTAGAAPEVKPASSPPAADSTTTPPVAVPPAVTPPAADSATTTPVPVPPAVTPPAASRHGDSGEAVTKLPSRLAPANSTGLPRPLSPKKGAAGTRSRELRTPRNPVRPTPTNPVPTPPPAPADTSRHGGGGR